MFVLEVQTGCNGISELEVRRVQWRRNFQFKDSSDLAKLSNSVTNMEMTHSCERAGGKSEFVSQRQWNRQQAPLWILRVRNEETAAGWPVPVLCLGLSENSSMLGIWDFGTPVSLLTHLSLASSGRRWRLRLLNEAPLCCLSLTACDLREAVSLFQALRMSGPGNTVKTASLRPTVPCKSHTVTSAKLQWVTSPPKFKGEEDVKEGPSYIVWNGEDSGAIFEPCTLLSSITLATLKKSGWLPPESHLFLFFIGFTLVSQWTWSLSSS